MKYKLSEIMEVIGGGTPKTKIEEYWNGDIPWLSVKDFNNDSRYVYKTEKNITREGLENSSTTLLQPNDIIISARGTVGELAMIPFPMAFNQSCYGLRAKRAIVDSNFLYYLLKFNIYQLKKSTHGSVFDTITRNTFTGIEVDIPNFDIQRRIARVLSNLDDKIETNYSINKNLEEQAQTIFDSFYEQADNEVPFTSLIQILGGGTPKTKVESYWNGDIPFFTPKDVGNPYTLSTEKTITPTGLEHCNSRLYPINTTFVTARGTVGKVSLAGVPMAMNQSCYALSGDNIHPLMTYFYTLKTVQSLKHKASGAVFDAIVTSDFKTETINKLSVDVELKALSLISPMMDNILQNSMENIQLATLRDTFLPRIMSGNIDVSNIEV